METECVGQHYEWTVEGLVWLYFNSTTCTVPNNASKDTQRMHVLLGKTRWVLSIYISKQSSGKLVGEKLICAIKVQLLRPHVYTRIYVDTQISSWIVHRKARGPDTCWRPGKLYSRRNIIYLSSETEPEYQGHKKGSSWKDRFLRVCGS